MRAFDVVGYTFQADNYHPTCVLPLVKAAHPLDFPLASTVEEWAGPEDILRTVAKSMRLDRDDEHSFDSGDFPKAVFASMVEDDERCGACGGSLIGDDEHPADCGYCAAGEPMRHNYEPASAH